MPNRYICDVLGAIRDCHKTRNYSYLLSLIEEAQYLATRMEASLFDKHDYEIVRAEIKKLEKKKKKLLKQVGEEPDDN